ncbi:MAG: hypothetical protein JJE05_01200 [Actinobacteria bacterium]|nr:hypothetical protein [Actinomycetota bacterium]
MQGDLKRLLEDASVGPRRPLDVGRAMERARRSRRRRQLGYGGVAALALLIPAALFRGGLDLPLPSPPDVRNETSPSPAHDPDDDLLEQVKALKATMEKVQLQLGRAISNRNRSAIRLERALKTNQSARASSLQVQIGYIGARIEALEAELESIRERLEIVERSAGRIVEACSAEHLVVETEWGAALGSYVAEVTFKHPRSGSCRLFKDFLVELRAGGRDRAIASGRDLESLGPPWVVVTNAHPAQALILWANWCEGFQGPFHYLVHPGHGVLRIDIAGSATCSGGEGTGINVQGFTRQGR